jgi:hypothetical protein
MIQRSVVVVQRGDSQDGASITMNHDRRYGLFWHRAGICDITVLLRPELSVLCYLQAINTASFRHCSISKHGNLLFRYFKTVQANSILPSKTWTLSMRRDDWA